MRLSNVWVWRPSLPPIRLLLGNVRSVKLLICPQHAVTWPPSTACQFFSDACVCTPLVRLPTTGGDVTLRITCQHQGGAWSLMSEGPCVRATRHGWQWQGDPATLIKHQLFFSHNPPRWPWQIAGVPVDGDYVWKWPPTSCCQLNLILKKKTSEFDFISQK